MPTIGVALSGGGHRASLFGLGVLMYLADAEKNRDVVCISSVSGGSLTNGYVAQAGNYRTTPGAVFSEATKPFAKQIASSGTLFASWITWLYLGALIVGFLACMTPFITSWPWWFSGLVCIAALLCWSFLLLERRGAVCGHVFGRLLYWRNGRATLLRDTTNEDLDHVICATDLHAGEHVYFSGRFICSYRLGWGEPADLRLDQAVQASAAFPGAFPVRWFRTAPHNFQGGTEQGPFMVLADGGVYDNMGEQWPLGVAVRKRRWPELGRSLHVPEEMIVVNASCDMGWSSVARLGIPLLGEYFTLRRVVDVLYDNTTAPRRRLMIQEFEQAARETGGMKGALLTIEQSPFRIPDYYVANTDWPERTARAKAVIEKLQESERRSWGAVVACNCGVRTTLSKLGPKTSAQLLYQGYVLAMANCHVLLDYPMLEIPTLARFEKFLE